MNRHIARIITFQALFTADVRAATPGDISEIVNFLIFEIHSISNAQAESISSIVSIAQEVLRKQSSLDEIITRAAPQWPIEKIAIVDRNILRLALFELLFQDISIVPHRVAINEAIEIAKEFGGMQSGRFVNGVLGSVYREMDDPDQTPKKIKKKSNSDKPEEKVGGIVFHRNESGNIFFCLVHDIFGKWTLPKGTAEYPDDFERSVKEKIHEETNLDARVLQKISENTYDVHHPELGEMSLAQFGMMYIVCILTYLL